MYIVLLSVAVIIYFAWRWRPRRPLESGFQYVYMNQDSSVRELSPGERAYLSEDFAGGDGARPYIKGNYVSRDGWGSRSGFIERRRIPSRIKILPVHPDYDSREKELGFDLLGSHRAAGDINKTNADGSTTCIPHPQISRKERFKLVRNYVLEQQRRREKLALVTELPPDDKVKE
jgi:hypothetical protein